MDQPTTPPTNPTPTKELTPHHISVLQLAYEAPRLFTHQESKTGAFIRVLTQSEVVNESTAEEGVTAIIDMHEVGFGDDEPPITALTKDLVEAGLLEQDQHLSGEATHETTGEQQKLFAYSLGVRGATELMRALSTDAEAPLAFQLDNEIEKTHLKVDWDVVTTTSIHSDAILIFDRNYELAGKAIEEAFLDEHPHFQGHPAVHQLVNDAENAMRPIDQAITSEESDPTQEQWDAYHRACEPLAALTLMSHADPEAFAILHLEDPAHGEEAWFLLFKEDAEGHLEDFKQFPY